MTDTPLRGDRDRPLVMGHRGDPTSTVENTIASIASAVDLGVDVVEIDIRMTSDGELVLFHDENMQRLTGIDKPVEAMDSKEIRQIKLDSTSKYDEQIGEDSEYSSKIPFLADVFEAFPRVIFNMDIKSKNQTAPELLADLLMQYEKQSDVIVASFHSEQISRFRKLCPNVTTSAHPGEVYRFVLGSKLRLLSLLVRKPEYQALQVPPRQGLLTIVDSRFVREAHKRDIEVHVWTINDIEEMERLLSVGVDGLFTDYPARMLSLLDT